MNPIVEGLAHARIKKQQQSKTAHVDAFAAHAGKFTIKLQNRRAENTDDEIVAKLWNVFNTETKLKSHIIDLRSDQI